MLRHFRERTFGVSSYADMVKQSLSLEPKTLLVGFNVVPTLSGSGMNVPTESRFYLNLGGNTDNVRPKRFTLRA